MEGLTLLRVESDVNGSSRVYLDTLLFFARASFSLVSSVPSILSENSMSEHLAWQETLLNPLAGSHLLKICRDEAMQAEAVAYFIKGGLLDNELVIIIARASLRNAILFHLNAMGLNVQFFKNHFCDFQGVECLLPFFFNLEQFCVIMELHTQLRLGIGRSQQIN